MSAAGYRNADLIYPLDFQTQEENPMIDLLEFLETDMGNPNAKMVNATLYTGTAINEHLALLAAKLDTLNGYASQGVQKLIDLEVMGISLVAEINTTNREALKANQELREIVTTFEGLADLMVTVLESITNPGSG